MLESQHHTYDTFFSNGYRLTYILNYHMGLVYVEMPRLASAFKINNLQRVVKTAMKTTLLFKMAVFLLSFPLRSRIKTLKDKCQYYIDSKFILCMSSCITLQYTIPKCWFRSNIENISASLYVQHN